MIQEVLRTLISWISENTAATICLGASAFFILLGSSNTTQVGGGLFRMTVDQSSRKSLTFLGIAFLIIGIVIAVKPSLPSFFLLNRSSPLEELHKAAIAWDESLGMQAIQDLQESDDECNQMLAELMASVLEQNGLYGFNYVNAAQNTIETQHPQCTFPLLDHPDQSISW